jgi:hypothetical protein
MGGEAIITVDGEWYRRELGPMAWRCSIWRLSGEACSREKAGGTEMRFKTESIYRRYDIVDATSLRDAAKRIDAAAGTISGTILPSAENQQTCKTA